MKKEDKNKWERRYGLVGVLCGIIALIVCTLFFRGTEIFGASSFRDVKNGDWFRSFVIELSEDKIISGYPDGTFRPSNPVTVGQFLAMIIQTGERAEALTSDFGTEGIADFGVRHHWARSFYDRALDEGLLFDDELPVTSLDRPISRQWMAVMASRMLSEASDGTQNGAMDAESDGGETKSYDKALDSIKDVEELTPYSYEIVTAYMRGLLSGYPDGTFRPEGYLSRAEAAAVIYKLNKLWAASETVSGGYDPAPSNMTVGTTMFWYQLPLTEVGERNEIKWLMEEHWPELADQLYRNFEIFADKALICQAEGKQGLRKEYVGGYPVLMEAVGDEVRIYIKPKGSETRFWDVEPGQVSEEFF